MSQTVPQIECRTFGRPDDKMDFGAHGEIAVVKMRSGVAGVHAVLEPGWTWSADEKPLLGNPETCPTPHTGYCIAGEVVVRMVATGEERLIRRGEFFEIPAGHDAFVPGSERCELVMFAPPEV